ncbi:MAG: hypothetical protein AB1410_07350 [Acidobacteriota bacterium]
MNSRIIISMLLILSISELHSIGKEKDKKILKTDLLKKKSEKIEMPKRNLFSPHYNSPSLKNTTKNEELKNEENELEIKFIGIIHGGKKKIAVLNLNDTILIVEEGEILMDGSKIIKITEKEIEILVPNGKKLIINLEEKQ